MSAAVIKMSIKWAALNPRDRRALTLLAGAAALILLVAFVVFPAWDAVEESARTIPIREKMLRKYRTLAAAAPQREQGYGALKDRLAEAEKGLLDSRTGPLAQAEVQQQLRDLAGAAGIQLPTTSFLPLRKISAEYAAVPVTAQFQGRLDQLVALLNAAHSAPKILAVDQLRVQPLGDPVKKLLNVSLVVSGVTVAEVVSELRP